MNELIDWEDVLEFFVEIQYSNEPRFAFMMIFRID